jgi:hypothetical protein
VTAEAAGLRAEHVPQETARRPADAAE